MNLTDFYKKRETTIVLLLWRRKTRDRLNMQLVVTDAPDGIPFKIKHLNLYDYICMSSAPASLSKAQKPRKQLNHCIYFPNVLTLNSTC